jgi:hypothetical protein
MTGHRFAIPRRERVFVGSDEPLGYPDGLNAYTVELSSPVGTVDPMGLDSVKKYGKVFLIEKVLSFNLIDKGPDVEIIVKGTTYTIKGSVRDDDTCDNGTKTPIGDPKPEDIQHNVKLVVSLPDAVGRDDASIRQFIDDAVFPELPMWLFNRDPVAASASPNCFYEKQWTPKTNPGEKLKPVRWKNPNLPKTEPQSVEENKK